MHMHIGPHAQTAILPLIFESLFYGVYLVLFGASIHVFRRRSFSPRLFLPSAIFMMWTLSTARIVIDSWKFYRFCSTGDVTTHFDIPLAMLHTTNNLIANSVMVYRCCILCNSTYATSLSALLFFASCVVGFVFPLSVASFVLALATHAVVTALSVSVWRIWSTGCRATVDSREICANAIHTILESGLLYSLSLLALALTSGIEGNASQITSPMTLPEAGPAFASVYAITSQLVGIAPTLSIVRAFSSFLGPPRSSEPLTSLHFGTSIPPSRSTSPQADVIQYPAKILSRPEMHPSVSPRQSWAGSIVEAERAVQAVDTTKPATVLPIHIHVRDTANNDSLDSLQTIV